MLRWFRDWRRKRAEREAARERHRQAVFALAKMVARDNELCGRTTPEERAAARRTGLID